MHEKGRILRGLLVAPALKNTICGPILLAKCGITVERPVSALGLRLLYDFFDYFMKVFARKYTRAVCYLGFGYHADTSGCHREGSTGIYLSSSALVGRHADKRAEFRRAF